MIAPAGAKATVARRCRSLPYVAASSAAPMAAPPPCEWPAAAQSRLAAMPSFAARFRAARTASIIERPSDSTCRYGCSPGSAQPLVVRAGDDCAEVADLADEVRVVRVQMSPAVGKATRSAMARSWAPRRRPVTPCKDGPAAGRRRSSLRNVDHPRLKDLATPRKTVARPSADVHDAVGRQALERRPGRIHALGLEDCAHRLPLPPDGRRAVKSPPAAGLGGALGAMCATEVPCALLPVGRRTSTRMTATVAATATRPSLRILLFMGAPRFRWALRRETMRWSPSLGRAPPPGSFGRAGDPTALMRPPFGVSGTRNPSPFEGE